MTGVATGAAARLWYGEPGRTTALLGAALAPAEALYRVITALRNRAYDRGVLGAVAAAIPVISVGNIAVGGTGKTPFTGWLALRLEQRGERPAIVHGGYAQDEPDLHRAWAPQLDVVVERDRARAVQYARDGGATVAVLDDAFQHRRLRRDLDIVLVSVERWSWKGRLLPRGPWRERPRALARADLIVCVRRTATVTDSQQLAAALNAFCGRPVMRVYLRATTWQNNGGTASAPAGAAILVAALADPASFATNARTAGADITDEVLFADHHDYTAADAERIAAVAGGRAIVTSAKDWVKLMRLMDPRRVWILTQEIVIEEGESVLDDMLATVLR